MSQNLVRTWSDGFFRTATRREDCRRRPATAFAGETATTRVTRATVNRRKGAATRRPPWNARSANRRRVAADVGVGTRRDGRVLRALSGLVRGRSDATAVHGPRRRRRRRLYLADAVAMADRPDENHSNVTRTLNAVGRAYAVRREAHDRSAYSEAAEAAVAAVAATVSFEEWYSAVPG